MKNKIVKNIRRIGVVTFFIAIISLGFWQTGYAQAYISPIGERGGSGQGGCGGQCSSSRGGVVMNMSMRTTRTSRSHRASSPSSRSGVTVTKTTGTSAPIRPDAGSSTSSGLRQNRGGVVIVSGQPRAKERSQEAPTPAGRVVIIRQKSPTGSVNHALGVWNKGDPEAFTTDSGLQPDYTDESPPEELTDPSRALVFDVGKDFKIGQTPQNAEDFKYVDAVKDRNTGRTIYAVAPRDSTPEQIKEIRGALDILYNDAGGSREKGVRSLNALINATYNPDIEDTVMAAAYAIDKASFTSWAERYTTNHGFTIKQLAQAMPAAIEVKAGTTILKDFSRKPSDEPASAAKPLSKLLQQSAAAVETPATMEKQRIKHLTEKVGAVAKPTRPSHLLDTTRLQTLASRPTKTPDTKSLIRLVDSFPWKEPGEEKLQTLKKKIELAGASHLIRNYFFPIQINGKILSARFSIPDEWGPDTSIVFQVGDGKGGWKDFKKFEGNWQELKNSFDQDQLDSLITVGSDHYSAKYKPWNDTYLGYDTETMTLSELIDKVKKLGYKLK